MNNYNPNAIAEGHNPDKLTNDQVGVLDGWRLLERDEIDEQRSSGVDFGEIELWSPVWTRWNCNEDWQGREIAWTYRTQRPPGYFLPESVGKPAEPEPDMPELEPSPAASRKWETGAQRDADGGKGSPYLIPTCALRRLAVHSQIGATKYGIRNWEKGIPLHSYYDSAFRHLLAWKEGRLDEDHLAAAMWNIASAMATEEAIARGDLPTSLADHFRTPIT